MADRYDVVNFRKTQNGKTYAVRLGSAVPSKNGDGFALYLDAMPAPEDGQYKLNVVPPRERQNSAPAPSQAADDELPPWA